MFGTEVSHLLVLIALYLLSTGIETDIMKFGYSRYHNLRINTAFDELLKLCRQWKLTVVEKTVPLHPCAYLNYICQELDHLKPVKDEIETAYYLLASLGITVAGGAIMRNPFLVWKPAEPTADSEGKIL